MKSYSNPTGVNKYTRKKSDPTRFYVDPKELSLEIKKSQEQRRCTDRLAEMTLAVMKNVMMWPKFRYRDQETKDEIRSYALLRWLKTGIYSCKPEGNCFSYLTQALYSNALNRLMWLDKKAKDRAEYEKKVIEKLGIKFTKEDEE